MTQELHGVISLGGTVIGGSLNQRGLKGETGDKGDKGDAATIAVGTTTTGAAGTNASVTNSGDEHDAVFNFTIPKGDKGETGDVGAFIAEYGVTTYSEIVSAISQKKVVLCHAKNALDPDLDYYFVLSDYDGVALPSVYTFVRTVVDSYSASFQYVTCDTSNEWDIGSRNLVPQTRTVNGKALSQNITLDASDVGAQVPLVSGANIKTINGESLLGSGNIDTMQALEKALPTDNASGAIASFEDGSDLFDYLSCILSIDPVQDLHGYDKPWVGGAGYNKWDEQWEVGSIKWETGLNDDNTTNTIRSKNFIPATAEATYHIVANGNNANVFYYDSSYSLLGKNYVAGNGNGNFTTPSGTAYIRFAMYKSYGTTYNNDLAINYPSTVTTYSPYENLCPITGWTGANVVRAGVNLYPVKDAQGTAGTITYSVSNGVIHISGSSINRFDYSPTRGSVGIYSNVYLPAGHYTIKATGLKSGMEYILGSNGSGVRYISLTSTNTTTSFTMLHNGNIGYDILRVAANAETDTDVRIQIEIGDTATDWTFTPTTIPISWESVAGTVYGGTVDVVSGVLTDGRLTKQLTSAETITLAQSGAETTSFKISSFVPVAIKQNNAQISSHFTFNADADIVNPAKPSTFVVGASRNAWVQVPNNIATTVDGFKTWLDSQTIIISVELATPTTYQLDPVQVACLLGQNNVWADCGSIEKVQYKADVQKWVEKQLREINTAILALS